MTTPKETHFFAHAGRRPLYTGPGDDLLINKVTVSDPAMFAALFSGVDESIRVEASVTTMAFHEEGIAGLSKYAEPDHRVVVLLRDPHDRMVSAFRYLQGRGHEDLHSIGAGLAAEPERRELGWSHMWRYQELSRYGRPLAAFADVYGPKLHVMIYEEFRADPTASLSALAAFLDIDPAGMAPIEREINSSGVPRSAVVTGALNLARRSPLLVSAVRRLPLGLREVVRRSTLRLDPVGSISENVDFEHDVKTVELVLGRTVEVWR